MLKQNKILVRLLSHPLVKLVIHLFYICTLSLIFTTNVNAEVSVQNDLNILKPYSIENTTVHSLYSAKLTRAYQLFIQTPPGYQKVENSKRNYPVIYINDGPTAFPIISGTLRPGISSGMFEPAILVGISYAIGESGMNSRIRDFTPKLAPSWNSHITGGAPQFLDFVADEVVPFVENNFRASSNHRTLTGHSLGGLFSVFALATKPELFSSYIITSPSIWFEDEYIFKVTKDFLAKKKQIKARIYIASGSLELMKNAKGQTISDVIENFSLLFEDKKQPEIELVIDTIDGANHHTIFPMAFAKSLPWLLRAQ
ncbi:alpha/beta hydrolase [Thalassotalea agariperforans]